MNNPWREIGFISKDRPKKHVKIIRIKKRVAKSKKVFKRRQYELIQLHLRNRIKYLIIENLEKALSESPTKKRIQKSLK
ncbi:uncharacterized protein LOC27208253 [Drosophila simulans]|uniref:uncharacterized protein LOC27208253 n=1 Tax=Drosophila simulans TaxID=7240 RepID=UPI00078AE44A|nr:uncharacterized protein LOC27208253 [Drosophila simulans]KMZ04318.1 uncharacterized protein Dsimw501_GD28405 [Drosophila simulans]